MIQSSRFGRSSTPKELQIDKQVPWQDHKAKDNRSGPARVERSKQGDLEFNGAPKRSMTLELLFDGYEQARSIEGEVAILEELSSSRDPESSKEEDRRPHHCVVGWGDVQDGMRPFRCVIESLSVKYTMWNSKGVPLRATCTVKLTEAYKMSETRESMDYRNRGDDAQDTDATCVIWRSGRRSTATKPSNRSPSESSSKRREFCGSLDHRESIRMVNAMKRSVLYQVRRHGWTRRWFLVAVKALRPALDVEQGDSVLGAELLAQLREAAEQTPPKATDAIWEALNAERHDRIPCTSPRMYPLARVLLDTNDVGQLDRVCDDPVSSLIELLEELHPAHRSDAALEESPLHLAAIAALGQLRTPKALAFLVSWLPNTILSAGTHGVFATLRAAGRAAHAAIIGGWKDLPWSWRAPLIEEVEGLRHETIFSSFSASPAPTDWGERLQFMLAASLYQDDRLIPAVCRVLDLCLDDCEKTGSGPDRENGLDHLHEIFDIIIPELEAVLTKVHRARYRRLRERVAAKLSDPRRVDHVDR